MSPMDAVSAWRVDVDAVGPPAEQLHPPERRQPGEGGSAAGEEEGG